MATDGVLTGGPSDGSIIDSGGADLIEIQIDHVIHRYIRTTRHRQESGGTLTVFAHDGSVDPANAQDGAEHVENRTASPLLADQKDHGED